MFFVMANTISHRITDVIVSFTVIVHRVTAQRIKVDTV